MRFLLISTLLLMAISGHTHAKEMVYITNGEWAPYLSQDLPHYGVASHLVKEAFATQGIDVVYGFFPWKRSYKLAKEGHWHGSVVWVRTPEREDAFIYSDVVITDYEHLFHLKSLPLDWKTIEDLEGLRIGGTLHTAYPIFEAAEKKNILILVRSGTYENLYHRLLKRRIDAIPQVSAVGEFLIRTQLNPYEQQKITFSSTIIQKREYALILTKAIEENKRYLTLFNRGLERLRQTGRYDQMMNALKKGAYDP